jgi:putative membrane protein
MDAQERRLSDRGNVMKRLIYALTILGAIFLGITFAYQNRQAIEVTYYFGLRWGGSLSLALLTVFAIGIAAGYLLSLQRVVRMQRDLVKARMEIRQVEQEVQNLRALPIKDVL